MKIHILAVWLLLQCSVIFAGTIAIYGDTRTNHQVHEQVIAAIAGHRPQIAFHTGDLVQRGLNQAEYDRWFNITEPLLSICPVYPARGNHERDAELFLQQFPALGSRTYYSVVYDSIIWVVLDSNLDLSPGSEQFEWLVEEILPKLMMPIVVLLHHPIFSSGEHGDELGLQLYLPDLFASRVVVLVISGHEHQYERSSYDGRYYLISGGGGAPLREGTRSNPHSQVLHKVHHYLIAERAGNELGVTVYDLEGAVLDQFNLQLR